VTPTIRVLGLGNDLLADDAFGMEIVRELGAHLPPGVQTASSIASGFGLLDDLLDADRLIVVDTISSGQAAPGTVHRFEEGEVTAAGGTSPHYVGLFETLRLGRALGLHVPGRVVILAVEAGDCLTIGGAMGREMRAAMPAVVRMVEATVAGWIAGP
jgi:hydrogenase maturation protease